MFKRILNIVFWGGLFSAALSGAAVSAFYYEALGSLPNVAELKEVSFEIPMKIYTADHKLIGEFGESKRIPVRLEDIPLKMRQAFLAIEDSRFYEHSGIDPIGILRAVFVAVSSAEASQGASTITQQVARNFFLTREKTLERKIREIFISLRIEQVLTKDEIFELYLNKIALGHRSFGVAAAAQTYYGKDLNSLTLGQMATIAGLPKAPSTLNPISHPERARQRRHLVLTRMRQLGYISEEECAAADSEPYKTYFHAAPLGAYAPFVAENARQFALDLLGESAYTEGIEIFTTVGSAAQEAAHYAVFKGVNAYDRRHGWRGARLNVTEQEGFDASPAGALEFLRKHDLYHYVAPAIVTAVDDESRSVRIYTSGGQSSELAWEGLKWASPFQTDRSMGPDPQIPSEILKVGDLIYTYTDEDGVGQLAQLPEAQGALVAINPLDGRIEALVGGYDFALSKFDRTTQATRQTGSNIKPFLYSAAVAKNININSVFLDEPIKTWDPGSRTWWEPKNTPNRYDGPMTLREGLAKSKNVVSIRLIRQIGVQNAVEHISKFGFEVPRAQQVESMALGSVEVTPLELVTGYAAFANGGYRVEPFLIERILKNGTEIYARHPPRADPEGPDRVKNGIALTYDESIPENPDSPPQVLSHGNAYIVADMLRTVIYGGTGLQGKYWGTGGRAFNVTGRQDLHGKTGTTNDIHDAWFSGFNANLAATAWMGFDTNRDLGWSRHSSEGGAYTALPIWAEFFKRAQDGVPEAPLPVPAGIRHCRSPEGQTDLCLTGGTSVNDSAADEAGSGQHDGIDTSGVSEDSIF